MLRQLSNDMSLNIGVSTVNDRKARLNRMVDR